MNCAFYMCLAIGSKFESISKKYFNMVLLTALKGSNHLSPTLQGGFNAGDGIRFFNIPGSRTNDILNLPSTSNVARPGQWMFRTDEASVEAGGCDSRGTIFQPPIREGRNCKLNSKMVLTIIFTAKFWHKKWLCDFGSLKQIT